MGQDLRNGTAEVDGCVTVPRRPDGRSLRLTPCQPRWPWPSECLAGAEYDRHLDAVSARIGVTDACSDPNRPNQRVLDAAARLGIDGRTITRNADPERRGTSA
jgi:hypothetical protein